MKVLDNFLSESYFKEIKKTLDDQVTVKKELTKATNGIKEKFEEIGII